MRVVLNQSTVLDVLRSVSPSDQIARCALRAELLARLGHDGKLTLLHVLDLLDYMHLAGCQFALEWSTSTGTLTTQAWTRRPLDETVIDPRSVLYLRVLPAHEPALTAPAARQNVGA